MIENIRSMTDRELLLVLVERQQQNISQLEVMGERVTRIEEKILADVETRVRNLEQDNYERRGMYKLWLFVVGSISMISLLVSIFTKL